MATPELRLNNMLVKLRHRGHRVTPQRMAILTVLAESQGHPGVEDIFNTVKPHFPTTSLATIYKTISLMKDLGELLELEFSGSGNRYDGNNPHPHPHVICTDCGSIVDPDVSQLAQMTENIAETTGYRIVNHRLDFYGVCPECQEKGTQPNVWEK